MTPNDAWDFFVTVLLISGSLVVMTIAAVLVWMAIYAVWTMGRKGGTRRDR